MHKNEAVVDSEARNIRRRRGEEGKRIKKFNAHKRYKYVHIWMYIRKSELMPQ